MYSHFGSTEWVTPFGLIVLSAVAVSWCLARRNARVVNIHGSHIDLLLPLSVIVGAAGGLLLSLSTPADLAVAGEHMQTGIRVRLFPFLGFAALALFIYSRPARLPFRRLLDVFALPTVAGLMIYRFGCFLAGCCWGDVVASEQVVPLATQVQTLPFLSGPGVAYSPGSLPYEQHLALGLIEPGAAASLPVHPVQLYEAALLFLILLLSWRVRWCEYPRGVFAVAVACAYAALRFLVEYLRADGAIVFANLTIIQLQCLLILSSVVLLRHAGRHRHPGPH